MWLILYPHGVTVACRVSEIVPTLQQISCLDKHIHFCCRGERTPGVLSEISPRRAGLHFFHLPQIQDKPTLPKQPGRAHLTEETLAWFQPATAAGASLFQITFELGRRSCTCMLTDDETLAGFSSGLFFTHQETRGKKIPAVFMTSATHTGILIAVSLPRGEEIDYLKASPTPAYFHMPFSDLLAFSSFFLFFLSHYSVIQVVFFAPSCCITFPPFTTSKGCIEKDATE